MPDARADSRSKPLKLEDLSSWVSPETLEWLREGDVRAAALQDELDEAGTDFVVDLFNTNNDNNTDDDHSDDSDRSDADFEGFHGRIRVWTSSLTNRDGIGSRYLGVEEQAAIVATDNGDDHHRIRIVYIISESWKGYGDLLWASSRHLANTFSSSKKCRDLLGPTFRVDRPDKRSHPLCNAKVLELGAGCGVPSLMAIKCGARVVCTDLDDTNRIRSIAESMQRNWNEIQTIPNLDEIIKTNAPSAMACPFRWGESSDPVAKCLNRHDDGTEKFDLICATDCLFMPWLHYELLNAVDELLALDGVCIMAFAIHESFSKDEDVWPFVDKAQERGFKVEILDAVQLTPPRKGMPAKQGLVNILRLTRQR
jgi:predicted nicotinamide N-methyase